MHERFSNLLFRRRARCGRSRSGPAEGSKMYSTLSVIVRLMGFMRAPARTLAIPAVNVVMYFFDGATFRQTHIYIGTVPTCGTHNNTKPKWHNHYRCVCASRPSAQCTEANIHFLAVAERRSLSSPLEHIRSVLFARSQAFRAHSIPIDFHVSVARLADRLDCSS